MQTLPSINVDRCQQQISRIRNYYDSIAEHYNDLLGYAPIESYDIFLSRPWLKRMLHSVKKADLIVDFGCGTGWDVISLRVHGYNAVGLDLSKNMISIGQKSARRVLLPAQIDIRQIDYPEVSLKRESVRCILCVGSVISHFLSDSDLILFLRIINNIIETDGVLILEFDDYLSPFAGQAQGVALHYEHPVTSCSHPITTIDLWHWNSPMMESRLIFVEDGKDEMIAFKVQLRAISTLSLSSWLADCGFEVVAYNTHAQGEKLNASPIYIRDSAELRIRKSVIIQAKKVRTCD